MEARAFDAPTKRTWAREATFTPRDGWFIAGAAAIAVIAVMMAVMTGAWNFVIA
jgi:energy-coupling factor transport system permease protein